MTPSLADLGSVFALGLLGSAHCVGMCGPLVLALPGRTGRTSAHLAYHLGRVTTYTIVGGLAGSAGAGMTSLGPQGAALRELPGVQVALSLVAAALLLAFGLGRLGIVRPLEELLALTPLRWPGVGALMQRAYRERQTAALVAAGLLLGLLPCGLSYAAFARALPAGGPVEGALLTAVFGLGTLPALLLVGMGASGWVRRHQRPAEILSALLMIGMAVSLALDAML
jgi:sulfite exporter TauE/SafE